MIIISHNLKQWEEKKIYIKVNRIKIKTKNLSLNSNGSTNMKSSNKVNLNKITCHPISKHTYKITNNSLLFSLNRQKINRKLIIMYKIKIKSKRKLLLKDNNKQGDLI